MVPITSRVSYQMKKEGVLARNFNCMELVLNFYSVLLYFRYDERKDCQLTKKQRVYEWH